MTLKNVVFPVAIDDVDIDMVNSGISTLKE